jgi:GAF domain-containing protein/anti-sigma regulatory factor (Ser/Thr protein kinase)
MVHLVAYTPTTPEADEILVAAHPRHRSEVGAVALVENGEIAQIADAETADPHTRQLGRARGWRSVTLTPLMNQGSFIGFIASTRREPGVLADHQLELLRTFADQAVIAIQNTRLFNETQEALERQTATAEVLNVIAASPTDTQPVFDVIARSATELCEGTNGGVFRLQDGLVHFVGHHNLSAEQLTYAPKAFPAPPHRGFMAGRAILDRTVAHVPDIAADPEYTAEAMVRAGFRSAVSVPMLRNGEPIGAINVTREEARPFSDPQIELLKSFADQAVIAIENARLFDEVQAKTRDLTESLQQQTATADVLKVISRSAFDLEAVFETVVERSARLSGVEGARANIFRYDGELLRITATYNVPPKVREWLEQNPIRPGRHSGTARAALERRTIHVPDVLADPEYTFGAKAFEPYRTILGVPIIKANDLLGVLLIYLLEFKPFDDKQISLVETFADQAAIAIENTRLFNETKEALERQTATADILNVIASSPTDTQPVFEAIASRAKSLVGGFSGTVFRFIDGQAQLEAFTPTTPEADEVLKASLPRPAAEFAPFRLTRSGEVMQIPDTEALTDQMKDVARARGYRSMLFAPLLNKGVSIGCIGVTRVQPGRFAEDHVQLLRTFADQAVIAIENVRLFDEVQARTRELSKSLDNLRTAQDRLVQTEKLASLGQLTAGIAHEIKNPLNFVNNFSALSAELIDELDETLAPAPLDQKMRDDVGELTGMLKSNLEKVVQHGKRADSIVKNMLLHSREGSGERRSQDLNALVSESLNLAYHGARAERSDFNITLEQDLDPDAGAVEVFPQDITRALLNLFSNGFYAAISRKKEADGATFEPVLCAATRNAGNAVEIRIRDNGTGIPAEIREKIFNPFFTTKPTGEGTGLGLSMTHDIIVKQHGGRIDLATEAGAFTEFTITLPRENGGTKPT